ncbi:MAG: hypothetical protein ACD_81C00069G0001 [uncultured bacterium]|uniref:Uncharacterized protein n=2 Tax=Candidatus Wolfeibacteriota TaxID=1752735 RepID=A0A0G1H7I8_9BACT|nr:MAG: hypothetical protein ACD_81C00069G0001 [uncultured bacterium]KKR13085.1 MAG: hypothetical protein UT41_C0001G0629 [Candidatus Wolfebacteria bacterium GW2011_GWC2_39_22]KKT42755.1 MAG: hypothetical protein UW32_C0004G0060 [Candidatus Wolfebacteria bacterium GW2011_GWE2_44_13]HBI26044.1 hypothetical protein [Candidatus Wolfebacteria bacterium]
MQNFERSHRDVGFSEQHEGVSLEQAKTRRILTPKSEAPKKFIVNEQGGAVETELSEDELENIGKILGKKYL